MKLFLLLAVILLTIGLFWEADCQNISWLRNFDDAKREAFFQTKLLLIYFERNSLQDGYMMQTETWNQPAIVELSKRFVCLRIEMQQWRAFHDQYERLRKQFRVDVVPTTIVTDPLGNEFYHGEGFIRAPDLQKVMEVLPRNLFAVYQALKTVDAEPQSISAKINAGIAYHRIRVAHISNRFLEEALGSDTLKQNPGLDESVETYRAINYHLLGDLRKSIDLFERLLDRFPQGEKQPVHLYYLAKLYLQDLNETQANKYLKILQKRFPNGSYTKQAEDLFGR